jgi:hypothetical protein
MDTRHREKVDAPKLGASVYLVECSVGEILPLLKLAQEGDTQQLMLACLAVTLEIDGERVSIEDLRNFGARKFHALMALGPQALRVDGIIAEEEQEQDEAAEEKKS